MAESNINVNINANASNFKTAINDAERTTKQFSQQAKQAGDKVGDAFADTQARKIKGFGRDIGDVSKGFEALQAGAAAGAGGIKDIIGLFATLFQYAKGNPWVVLLTGITAVATYFASSVKSATEIATEASHKIADIWGNIASMQKQILDKNTAKMTAGRSGVDAAIEKNIGTEDNPSTGTYAERRANLENLRTEITSTANSRSTRQAALMEQMKRLQDISNHTRDALSEAQQEGEPTGKFTERQALLASLTKRLSELKVNEMSTITPEQIMDELKIVYKPNEIAFDTMHFEIADVVKQMVSLFVSFSNELRGADAVLNGNKPIGEVVAELINIPNDQLKRIKEGIKLIDNNERVDSLNSIADDIEQRTAILQEEAAMEANLAALQEEQNKNISDRIQDEYEYIKWQNEQANNEGSIAEAAFKGMSFQAPQAMDNLAKVGGYISDQSFSSMEYIFKRTLAIHEKELEVQKQIQKNTADGSARAG